MLISFQGPEVLTVLYIHDLKTAKQEEHLQAKCLDHKKMF